MLAARIAFWDEDLQATNFIEFDAFSEEDAEQRALAIVNRGVVHDVCEDFDFIKQFLVTYKHRGRLWATGVDAATKNAAQLQLLHLQTYGQWRLSVTNDCST